MSPTSRYPTCSVLPSRCVAIWLACNPAVSKVYKLRFACMLCIGQTCTHAHMSECCINLACKEVGLSGTYWQHEFMGADAMQVLRSIAFLHSLDLIHSDLKPENILVKSYSR